MKISKADLHVHTRHSFDGVSDPHEMVHAAVNEGIRVIAVTDHDKIQGAYEAREAAKGLPLDVIIGQEVYTGEGELLGLFLNKQIPERKGLLKTIDNIHKQGGLVIVPHPFNWVTLKETITVKRMREIYEIVDAIEIINPSFFGKRGRRKAPRLNEFYGLSEIGSSDAHHYSHIGKAYTYFEGTSAEDLRKSITQKTTEAGHIDLWSRYEMLWLMSRNVKKYGKKAIKNLGLATKRIYQ